MVKIRFQFKGRKGQHSFRIVATDERKARDSGKFLEYLGFYNPQTKEINLHKDEIKKWLNYGAQPTDTVGRLLKKHL